MTRGADHTLLVYHDDAVFAGAVAEHFRSGVSSGAALVAVADRRKLGLIAEHLGDAAAELTMIDRDTHYTRPLAALADYDATVRHALCDGAPRVVVFGELPRLRGPEDARSWTGYEAILNHAFAGRPVAILCGYDAREVPASLVEGARRTHPAISGDGDRNPAFEVPAETVRALAPPPVAPGDLPALPLDGDLRATRARLSAAMAVAGVSADAAADLLAAAGEVLVNAERHGGGVREVRAGRSGERFVCEITDAGPGMDDPLAGWLPPGPERAAGDGLWVARQLTGHVDVVPTAAGLTVRLWL